MAAIVRDSGRLAVPDAVDILLDVCDELANAHANGIVHGDLGLHRVRTMWPRRQGDHVDIFALDADDTGAINFRAAFQAPALSPEQRAGRIGDQRSDIWALGAILHALLGGAPPSRRPVREVLAGAPHAIITCVESCLAENPDERPRSVDDVAGALASFATSSPERFQALARRRIASLKAKHNREELGLQPMPVAPVTAPILQPLARNETYPPPRLPSRPSYAEVPVAEVRMPSRPSYAEAPVAEARMPSRPSYADVPLAPPMPSRPSYAEAPVADARMPSRPSYADVPVARMPARPSYAEPSVSVEWPAIHGVPSQSIAVPSSPYPVAPYPVAPSAFPAAPVYPSASAYPAAAAYSSVALAIAPPSTFPSVAAPAGVPVPNPRATAPLFNPALYPAAQSSIPLAHTPSITPPPVSYGYEPVPYVPAPPPAHRAGSSYHPPSIGPVSVDVGGAGAGEYYPPPARIPSFSDLAEYREAKRASRKTAIFAVVAAAAAIVIGLGYGSQMLEKDRAAFRAAQAAAAAPAPPPPAVTAPLAPTPSAAPASTTQPPTAPASSGKSATSASAKPAPSAAPATRKPAKQRRAAAPATNLDPPATRDDRPEVAAPSSFSDAIGKKDPAPANALSDALK